MKQILILASVLTLMSACSKNDMPFSYENINANLDEYLTDKTVSVEVPTGSIAVVTMGSDTLAVSSTSLDVVVPKYITPTIDYVYASSSAKAISRANIVDPSLYSQLEKKQNQAYWQVLAFEDSKNGDYDYNDLILHNRYIIQNNQLIICIHPVAYGATKTINYGYEVYTKSGDTYTLIGKDEISDVRKNLFLDQTNSGFINTESYQRHYDGYTYTKTFDNCTKNLADYYIVSYIYTTDNSDKIYAINRENFRNVQLFDIKGKPYALVLHGVNKGVYTQIVDNKPISVGADWFQFPLEKVSIDDCYDIEGWLQGNKNNSSYLDAYIKTGAKVFNVNDNSRVSKGGNPARIYEVASPFVKVTDWQ